MYSLSDSATVHSLFDWRAKSHHSILTDKTARGIVAHFLRRGRMAGGPLFSDLYEALALAANEGLVVADLVYTYLFLTRGKALRKFDAWLMDGVDPVAGSYSGLAERLLDAGILEAP